MDAAEHFTRHLTKCKYEQISRDAIEGARRDILDTLGVSVAASGMLGSKEIAELVAEWGGKKESTVLVYGDRVPGPNAALVNGAMGRALDWDDTHDPSAGCHPGPAIVSGSFAIAELIGNISGKDFITAVTLGIDIGCRIMWSGSAAFTPPTMLEPGFVSHWASIAVAASAAKLMSLDDEQTLSSLGIAYCQAAGNLQSGKEGVETKGIQVGFASHAGVLAGLLARKGIKGVRNSLEGEYGLFNLYHRGRYVPSILTSELGERFESAKLSIKPYPCGRYIHPCIDATLNLVRGNDIEPEEIEEIVVSVDKKTWSGTCEPVEPKLQPQNAVIAQVSLYWAIATAVVKREVRLRHFLETGLADPAIRRMALKVKPRLDESLASGGVSPAVVEIRAKRGIFSQRVDFPLGSLENPLSWDGLVDKFRDCSTYAARPLSKENVDEVIKLVKNLELVEDVSQIIGLLVGH